MNDLILRIFIILLLCGCDTGFKNLGVGFLSSKSNSGPNPVIASFSASSASIDSGDASVLSWDVSGGETLSISPGIGRVTGTSLSVSPSVDTTYTLTATNISGTASAVVTVTLNNNAALQKNGVIIRDLSQTEQENRPFTVSRVFKQGEIQDFPQARVNGTMVLSQADVKNRWPDGSVKHVLVSFRTNLSARGSLNVDFINQYSGNNTGEMSKGDMLAYDSGNWGAEIQTSIGSANARQMIADWNGTDTGLNGQGIRYWLKGPIITQIIVEDKTPSLRYDFGSDNNCSLHPIFVLTFYPGTDLGVKVEYIVENMWTTKLQDQSYSLSLKTGNPGSTTVYNKAMFKHIGLTRWHKTFWSGQTPRGWMDPGNPGIVVDYNFPYMVSTLALPNFDQRVVVGGVSKTITDFEASDKGDIMGKGIWGSKFFGAIDDHTEATDLSLVYTRYLYTFNPRLYSVLLGQADVSAHVPIHYRDSAIDKFYDTKRNVDAFGLPISLNARPTVREIGRGSPRLADRITPVNTVSANGWVPEAAHQPSFTYLPYIITGDWYYGDEMSFWASVNLIFPSDDKRHRDWGFINKLQIRGEARGLRALGYGAFMSPDNSHEKEYFTEKLLNNIAILEGEYDVKDGSFYEPCTTLPYNDAAETSKWCWGRYSRHAGGGLSNPLRLITSVGDEDDPENESNHAEEIVEVAKTWYTGKPWQISYYYVAQSILVEFGYPIRKVRDATMRNLLGQLQHPDFNRNLVSESYMPVLRKNPDGTFGGYFESWTALKDAYVDTIENKTSFKAGIAVYGVEARAAASFLPGIDGGGLSGEAAWNWIKPKSATTLSRFPNWAWLPR